MGFEEELRNNYGNMDLEVLEDIVRNKKHEYTEEAYKIAVEELSKRSLDVYGDRYYNELEVKNQEIKLNVVKEQPDDSWVLITSSKVNSDEIVELDKLQKYIDVFNKNNIQYVTYFLEHIYGIKMPKYSNTLELYIREEEWDNAQELLFANNVLFNKEIDEIEELRGVDLEEPLVYEESKTMNVLMILMVAAVIIGINVFLVFMCINVSSGRIGLICAMILINLFFAAVFRKREEK